MLRKQLSAAYESLDREMRVVGAMQRALLPQELPEIPGVESMVGLFINPGSVPPAIPGASGRSTRSYEYDTPNDTYAKFLIDEMLPELAKHATAFGGLSH